MQESSFKLLKGAVLLGGVLLIVATIMLFVVLAKKIGASDGDSCSDNPAVSLPEGANMVQTQVEKQQLHITIMHNPEHYELLTIDRCTGEVTDILKIEAPTPPPPMPFG